MKRVWSVKTAFYELWKITSLWTQTGPWSDTASYALMMIKRGCELKPDDEHEKAIGISMKFFLRHLSVQSLYECSLPCFTSSVRSSLHFVVAVQAAAVLSLFYFPCFQCHRPHMVTTVAVNDFNIINATLGDMRNPHNKQLNAMEQLSYDRGYPIPQTSLLKRKFLPFN